MIVYVLTEVWGTGIDEVATSVYATRTAGLEALKKCVAEWLDGSDRDSEAEVQKAYEAEQFVHSDGFMRLTESELS